MANEEHLAILKQGVKEWNEWRHTNPDVHPDLSSTDLSGEDLQDADFSYVDFSYTVLTRANLSGSSLARASFLYADLSQARLNQAGFGNTDFRACTLRNAQIQFSNLYGIDFEQSSLPGIDLTYSYMPRANLAYTNLRGARLQHTSLAEVNLTGALVEGMDVSGALCGATYFCGLDLSLTKGLETITGGNNYIDVQTLYKSRGKIPKSFLIESGLPETLIIYLDSLTHNAIEYYPCFISYNHQDRKFAIRLREVLKAHDIFAFLDVIDINPGEILDQAIEQAISHTDKHLLCASHNSLNSHWVNIELNLLFKKEQSFHESLGSSIPLLIPLDLDGYLFSSECTNEYTTEIRSRVAADFKGWDQDDSIFEREIGRVIKALRTDGGKESPPASKLPPRRS